MVTDLKVRYQSSVLGYLWTLLKPLAIFSILYVVFVQLLKLGTSIPYNALYLLFGIVIWSLFAEASMQGVGSVVARADLLRKISCPAYVVVLAVVFSALITFSLSMLVIVLFMVILRVPVRLDILWLPLLFVELLAFSTSLAFFLSALFVRYRDVSYIWEVVLQAAFYATPIIYPLSMIPSVWAQRILLLNPMAQIIQDARYCLITDQTVTMTQVWGTRVGSAHARGHLRGAEPDGGRVLPRALGALRRGGVRWTNPSSRSAASARTSCCLTCAATP